MRSHALAWRARELGCIESFFGDCAPWARISKNWSGGGLLQLTGAFGESARMDASSLALVGMLSLLYH